MPSNADPSMSALTRPLVNVYAPDGKSVSTVRLPDIFKAPIRPDIVRVVHRNKMLSTRAPHAVSTKAGMQHSAKSWGPGRALARVPRVSGSGTHRAGQGSNANFCRKGRIAHPPKIWRKWNKNVNSKENLYALSSAIASSGIPAIVSAHGHKIDNVVELPLVMSNEAEKISRTKEAFSILKLLGVLPDIKRSKDSKTIRAGKGKRRNRKYVQRKGPLIVFGKDEGIVRAFRNIPGVDLVNVLNMEVIELAPGGSLGRLIIWTENAFCQLNSLFGTYKVAGTEESSKGRFLPIPMMTNPDITRIIESPEVQAVIKERPLEKVVLSRKRIDPYQNESQLVKLNPYALNQKKIPSAGYNLTTYRDSFEL